MSKYKYLDTKITVMVNKLLGYSKQAIRPTSKNHEPLLKALNDAIGEAIEKVFQKFGGADYKKNSDKKIKAIKGNWKDFYK